MTCSICGPELNSSCLLQDCSCRSLLSFFSSLLSLLQYYVGSCFDFWPWGMWSLTSLTRDWTYTSCVGGWSLNQWTIREIPDVSSIMSVFFIVLNHVQPCVNILWSFPELSLNKTVFQQGVSLELLQFFFSWWQNISKSLPCFSVSFSFPSFFNWLQSGFTSHFPQTSLNSSRATMNFLPNQNVNSVSILFNFFSVRWQNWPLFLT